MRLEETLAHQGAAIEDLSRQLSEQWRLIERLRTEIRGLTEQLEAGDEGDAPAADRKPPHW